MAPRQEHHLGRLGLVREGLDVQKAMCFRRNSTFGMCFCFACVFVFVFLKNSWPPGREPHF